MSIQNLRATFGPACHWCGLPMDFDEPRDREASATIEHLNDATLGSVRKQKHRRLAHQVCNRTRNEFRLQAERQFAAWVAVRDIEHTAGSLHRMNSFPENFRALVIGASGAIGAALVRKLQADGRCGSVIGLGRRTDPPVDFDDEDSIAKAALLLADRGPFHLILNATGILHTDDFMPEKRLGQMSYVQMEATFRANAFGPALVLAQFAPLLDRERGVLAVLSAKVGSIGDNRLGGWYSYRASKAALNMFLKTAAIEVQRSQPNAVLVALHPGTVDSALSGPFRGAQIGRAPDDVAADLLRVVDRLTAADTGGFFTYAGERLPW